MPLNFPANPTDQQVYDIYIYDAAKSAWVLNENPWVPNIDASKITSGTINTARIPNLQNLSGTLDVDSGGTGATTVAGAQDNLGVGLVPIKPSSVVPVTGTASINTLGKISFSNCTSIELYNVFSSNYQNYKIVLSAAVGGAAAISYSYMQLGNSTGFKNSSYAGGMNTIEAGYTAITNTTGSDGIYIGKHYYSAAHVGEVSIFNPAISGITSSYTGQFLSYGSTALTAWTSGLWNNTEAVTNLRLTISLNSLSGSIQVFGYND